MRDIPSLTGFTQPVTFDGFGQDDRGCPLVVYGSVIGRIHLLGIVSASQHFLQLGVAQVVHEFQQFRVFAKKAFANVTAWLGGIFLILAIHGFFHALDEQALVIGFKQRIPIRTPDDLDHIPSRAPEGRFQLLDDLPVATHRTVQALEVAVDHPHQVVELLARGQGERTERFGFIGLAIPHKTPDFGFLSAGQAPGTQIPVKTRLVNGHERPQPHGHRGKLPEARHQVGMRIRGQPATLRQFLPEIEQVFLLQAPHQKGTRIDARGNVTLDVQHVRRTIGTATTKEMVKTDLIQGGTGGIGGDVSSQSTMVSIGINDHRHRIPPDVAFDPSLDFPIPRVSGLVFFWNGVDVGGADRQRHLDSLSPQTINELVQKQERPLRCLLFEQFGDEKTQGFEPFVMLCKPLPAFSKSCVGHQSDGTDGLFVQFFHRFLPNLLWHQKTILL